MWQHHFEFLLLGYGAYATFAELLQGHLPDIPDQHIAQMVAGIDVLLFKPDAELRRLARLAIDTGVDGAFVEGPHAGARSTPSCRSPTPDARGCAELEKVKDPWFNMATGDGLTHHYRSWLDDPSIPYASLIGHVAALRAGEADRAADRGDPARARPARRRVRRAARRGVASRRSTACCRSRGSSSRTSRSTSSSATTGSSRAGGTRSASSARCSRARLPRGRRGRLPADALRGGLRARRAGADVGDRRAALGPGHWPPIVARRRSCSSSSASGRRRRRSGSCPRRSPTR